MNNILIQIANQHVKDARMAALWVRDEADMIVEQLARRDRGWDRGAYRDDDTLRDTTIAQRTAEGVELCTYLSRKWGQL